MSPALSSACGSVTTSAPFPDSSAADSMLCVHNLWVCAESCEGAQWPSECAGNRARKASVHRSSTSNKVTGKQSLSSNTKLIPRNIATRAASTKVPAQVGCTWCNGSCRNWGGISNPPLGNISNRAIHLERGGTVTSLITGKEITLMNRYLVMSEPQVVVIDNPPFFTSTQVQNVPHLGDRGPMTCSKELKP